MNINEIIDGIENKDDIVERCISYSEVILFLKSIKNYHVPIENPANWKDEITNKIINGIHVNVDKAINEVKDMIKANVEYNKNKLI